jgi:hypothetical protein
MDPIKEAKIAELRRRLTVVNRLREELLEPVFTIDEMTGLVSAFDQSGISFRIKVPGKNGSIRYLYGSDIAAIFRTALQGACYANNELSWQHDLANAGLCDPRLAGEAKKAMEDLLNDHSAN